MDRCLFCDEETVEFNKPYNRYECKNPYCEKKWTPEYLAMILRQKL